MDTKIFCNKVADALNISLKWYTKEDYKRCVNFTPDLNAPIILNNSKSNIQLSFDLYESLGSINADIYKVDTNNWYILSAYKDGSFSLQENLLNGDIIFIYEGKSLNTCISNLLKRIN